MMTDLIYVAQAVDTGVDIGRLLGTGGPLAGAGALLGYLAKLYLDSRRDKREDAKSARESESGIVETTSAAIKLVREQMITMGTEINTLKEQVADRDRQIRQIRDEYDMEIEKLNDRVRGLEVENEQLRRDRQAESS
jgi:hypothetical protein